MPFCAQLATLMACSAITGITMGFLDTGGNVWCLDLWGRHSAPLMQALHFCFALGALVAPLIAEPFLSPASLSRISPTYSLGNASLALETYANIPPIGIHHGIVVSRHHSHVMPHLLNSPLPPDIVSRPRRSVGEEPMNSTYVQFPSSTNISKHNESDAGDEAEQHTFLNSTNIESNDTSRIESSNSNQTTSSTPAPSSTTPAKKPTKPFYAEGPKKEDKWDRKSQKKAPKGPAVAASPNSTNSSTHTNATSLKPNSTTSPTPAPVSKQSSAVPVSAQTALPPLSALNESSKAHSSNGNASTETSAPNNSSGTGGESTLQEGTNATLQVPSSVGPISSSTVSSEVTTGNPTTRKPSTSQVITTKRFSVATTGKPNVALVTDPAPEKHDV
uniref:Putative sodium-dependent glucose transporter 1-like isoform 1 n=1 Tax=Amblyomma americanum TaxID=6943 RepID=A0A0C9RYB2_AMBAM